MKKYGVKCTNNNVHVDNGLHYSEITVYSFIWVGGVIYSIYRIYLKCQEFAQNFPKQLKPGWSILNRLKDVSDLEWSTFLNIFPWIALAAVTTALIGDFISTVFTKKIVLWFHIISSTLFSVLFFGFKSTLVFYCQLLLFYIYSKCKSKTLVWIFNFATILLLNNLTFMIFMQDLINISDDKYVIWCISVAWNNLRGTSYSLDSINYYNSNNSTQTDKYSFIKYLSYYTFIPTLLTGPIILYDTFEKGFLMNDDAKIIKYKNLSKQMARYMIWLSLSEFMLHFLYTNVLDRFPNWVQMLSPWEMYGYGYLLGQFFLLKYVVIYGMAGALTRLHNVEAPRTPKCIARIHRYSDMWRYFDPGLHSFLFRYVYLPIRMCYANLLKSRLLCKIISSSVCFFYIFFWHGTKPYIMVWSFLNFLAVTIETISDFIEASPSYQRLTKKYLSHYWQLRFNSAITCPLLAMSAISNFYFFAGLDIGTIFLEKFLYADWWVNLTLFGFLYAACNVSHKIKIWEMRKEKLEKEKLNKTD